MGYWIGVVLLTLGLLVLGGTFAHGLWRNWISRREPQMAPSRLPPELYVIGAVFAGIGAYLVYG